MVNARRGGLLWCAGAVATLGSGWAVGCVGDDPAVETIPVPVPVEAGVGETGAAVDAGQGAGEGGPGDAGSDAVAVDAGACDTSKTFGAPALVPNINTTSNENAARFSRDGLTVYVDSERPGGLNGANIWAASRLSVADGFGPLSELLGPVNSDGYDGFPSLTADHKTMYFASNAGGGPLRLYVSSRNTTAVAFGAPSEVPGGGADRDAEPWVGKSGIIYFSTSRDVVNYELWRTTPSGGGNFSPTPIAELNMAGRVSSTATLTDDELTIYFGSDRDVAGNIDIWTASRGSDGEAFGKLAKVTELSTGALEYPVYVEPDGCSLYFAAFRGSSGVGQRDIWVAKKPK